MNSFRRTNRPAFTLVEMLTVIAIIGLLIGVLVPSLQKAKDLARRTVTRNQLKVLGEGCEGFHAEFDEYPQSRGENPFEGEGSGIFLSGAQWLAIQLVGPDQQGYVNPTRNSDVNGDNKIDSADWLEWYSLNTTLDFTRKTFVEPDGKILTTPERYVADNPGVSPTADYLVGSNMGSSVWDNSKLPFFIDGFGFPILYYRATPKAPGPYTNGTRGSNLRVGIYDHADNAQFTGSEGMNGLYTFASEGWDLTGGGFPHPMAKLGYRRDRVRWPDAGTFAAVVSDRARYESTLRGNEGVISPHNPNTFIMISAGKDGLYGSADDIRNFQTADD